MQMGSFTYTLNSMDVKISSRTSSQSWFSLATPATYSLISSLSLADLIEHFAFGLVFYLSLTMFLLNAIIVRNTLTIINKLIGINPTPATLLKE